MIKKAHTLRRVAGTFVFIAAVIASQFSGVQLAHAATLTWDGSSSGNLNTAANWSGNAVPVSGDVVTFPAGVATTALTNDLVGVNLGGVIIAGGGSSTTTAYTINTLNFATGATITTSGTDTTLTVSGAVASAGTLSITGAAAAMTFSGAINTIGDFTEAGSGAGNNVTLGGTVTVGGNAVITGTYGNNIYFNANGALHVTGNLTVSGSNVDINNAVTVDGNLVVTAGLYNYEVYTVAGTVTVGDVNNYGNLYLSTGSAITGVLTVVKGSFGQVAGSTITLGGLVVDNGASATLSGTPSYPITFGSGASAAYPSVVWNTGTWDSQAQKTVYENLAINSPITLLNNLSVRTNGDATSGSVNFAGAVTYNGFTISKYLGSTGKLLIGGTEIKNAPVTTSYTGNLPQTNFEVAESETATLSGTRQNASVDTGGILKGTGTLTNDLFVDYGGTVSPGNSPGTLTTLQTLSLNPGAIYQAELLNASSYDQLAVGAQYTGSGHAVTLGSGTNLPTLNLVLYSGYSIKKGDSFKIIDNKSATTVSGTFAGLAEGTQFVVSGITFNITYVGGDGNDVVVTALSAGTDPKGPNTSVAETIAANPATILVLGIVTAGFFGLVANRRRFNR